MEPQVEVNPRRSSRQRIPRVKSDTNHVIGDMKKKTSTLHPITIGKRSSTRGSLYTRTRSGVTGLRRLQRKAQLSKGSDILAKMTERRNKLSKGLLKGCKTPKTDKNEKDLNLKESTTEPSSGLPIPLSILSNIPDIGLCALEEEPHCGSSDKTEVSLSSPRRSKRMKLSGDLTSSSSSSSSDTSPCSSSLLESQRAGKRSSSRSSSKDEDLEACSPEIALQNDEQVPMKIRKQNGVTGKNNQSKSREINTGIHRQVLESWGQDCTPNSKKAPILWALDHMAEKLNEDTEWMPKARLIWSRWKKVPVSIRTLYLERAKANRKGSNFSTPEPTSSESSEREVETIEGRSEPLRPTTGRKSSSPSVPTSHNTVADCNNSFDELLLHKLPYNKNNKAPSASDDSKHKNGLLSENNHAKGMSKAGEELAEAKTNHSVTIDSMPIHTGSSSIQPICEQVKSPSLAPSLQPNLFFPKGFSSGPFPPVVYSFSNANSVSSSSVPVHVIDSMSALPPSSLGFLHRSISANVSLAKDSSLQNPREPVVVSSPSCTSPQLTADNSILSQNTTGLLQVKEATPMDSMVSIMKIENPRFSELFRSFYSNQLNLPVEGLFHSSLTPQPAPSSLSLMCFSSMSSSMVTNSVKATSAISLNSHLCTLTTAITNTSPSILNTKERGKKRNRKSPYRVSHKISTELNSTSVKSSSTMKSAANAVVKTSSSSALTEPPASVPCEKFSRKHSPEVCMPANTSSLSSNNVNVKYMNNSEQPLPAMPQTSKNNLPLVNTKSGKNGSSDSVPLRPSSLKLHQLKSPGSNTTTPGSTSSIHSVSSSSSLATENKKSGSPATPMTASNTSNTLPTISTPPPISNATVKSKTTVSSLTDVTDEWKRSLEKQMREMNSFKEEVPKIPEKEKPASPPDPLKIRSILLDEKRKRKKSNVLARAPMKTPTPSFLNPMILRPSISVRVPPFLPPHAPANLPVNPCLTSPQVMVSSPVFAAPPSPLVNSFSQGFNQGSFGSSVVRSPTPVFLPPPVGSGTPSPNPSIKSPGNVSKQNSSWERMPINSIGESGSRDSKMSTPSEALTPEEQVKVDARNYANLERQYWRSLIAFEEQKRSIFLLKERMMRARTEQQLELLQDEKFNCLKEMIVKPVWECVVPDLLNSLNSPQTPSDIKLKGSFDKPILENEDVYKYLLQSLS